MGIIASGKWWGEVLSEGKVLGDRSDDIGRGGLHYRCEGGRWGRG